LQNDSKVGLGGIWTQNLDKAQRLSSMIQSGIVPNPRVVVPDPGASFGSVKSSGFGRDLSGCGMLEFVNITD
jgi:acyl-CoA reductase-like NAD-dependent aldehyde dehydrogenase